MENGHEKLSYDFFGTLVGILTEFKNIFSFKNLLHSGWNNLYFICCFHLSSVIVDWMVL